jgi:hypothetical protein
MAVELHQKGLGDWFTLGDPISKVLSQAQTQV